ARHGDVAEDEVRAGVAQQIKRLPAVACFKHHIAGFGELVRDIAAQDLFIFDAKNEGTRFSKVEDVIHADDASREVARHSAVGAFADGRLRVKLTWSSLPASSRTLPPCIRANIR